MNERFRTYVEELEPKLQELLSMEPVTPLSLPRKTPPKEGVYLFSENGKHLYVGRTRRLRQRIREQSRSEEAPFAFRLAREETGCTEATYTTKGSRKDLMSRPEFQDAVRNALSRIQQMEVRYVEEDDPIKQTLLEIYVAVVLETPYNSFATS